MLTFAEYLKEHFVEDFDFSGCPVHHEYKNDGGHHIKVYKIAHPDGHILHYVNHTMHGLNGDNAVVTGMALIPHGTNLSKSEIENLGKPTTHHALEEDFDSLFLNLDEDIDDDSYELALDEAIVSDKKEKVDADAAGKIAEHATQIQMIGLMHKQNKTEGSAQHLSDVKPHEDAIKALAKKPGITPEQVAIRRAHGVVSANLAMEHIKSVHGPQAKISRVGHTSKAGDIAKFTKGKHKDGQENPSDMGVAIINSNKSSNKKEEHYEGYSLKSSESSSNITAKNPEGNVGGMLDTDKRKLQVTQKSTKGIHDKVLVPMGVENKTRKEREAMIAKARTKEGVKSGSSIEKKANDYGYEVKGTCANELHTQLKHVMETGQHHLIGHMLHAHLTPDTSMPVTKIHAQGGAKNATAKASAVSESPLKKVFKNKNTRYSVVKQGHRVSIGYVHPKTGAHVPVADYTPKTKDNVLKSGAHGWNVKNTSIN